MMAKIVKDFLPSREKVFIFANTGQEDERTLRFVHEMDKEFHLNLVWVEAKVNPIKGQGTSFNVVNFETAARNGEPFNDVMAKYGIPNKNYPHCNREMKIAPIHSYARSLGWTQYNTFIGIRADELDRMDANRDKKRFFYPLVKLGCRKEDVLTFWRSQKFDLDLPEHRGNCKTCWKKSIRKLMTLAVETPDIFDFMREAEKKFDNHQGRKFFRGHRTVDDIFAMTQEPFEKFTDPNFKYDEDLDSSNGCGESCDAFSEPELEYDL